MSVVDELGAVRIDAAARELRVLDEVAAFLSSGRTIRAQQTVQARRAELSAFVQSAGVPHLQRVERVPDTRSLVDRLVSLQTHTGG